MLFDTGSNLVWMYGEREGGAFRSITYGRGYVSGYMAKDTIQLGPLVVTGFPWLAVDRSKDLEGFMGRGIVGLGHIGRQSHPDYAYSIIDQLFQ